jgi:hypothetical protein
MYEEFLNQQNVSYNASVQNFSSNMIIPSIKEYNDGILIDFGGFPYYVEYHDANVQVWRDKDGRIVSIDIVYEDGNK